MCVYVWNYQADEDEEEAEKDDDEEKTTKKTKKAEAKSKVGAAEDQNFYKDMS